MVYQYMNFRVNKIFMAQYPERYLSDSFHNMRKDKKSLCNSNVKCYINN